MNEMDTIQPFENINFGEVCRACFERCEQYKMLFEDAETIDKRSLGDVFFDVVQIKIIAKKESSPSRICLPCSKDLIGAYNFIHKSKQNNDRLLEYVKNIKQPDCLSEFPIDIPNESNATDCLHIKVENESINEYIEPLSEDKLSAASCSDSGGSDYDESPLHEKQKINKMQCTYCNRIFKRLDFLENHKRKHEEEIRKKEGSAETTFLCDECGFSCSSNLELKTHRITNHTARVMSSERENSDSSANQNNSVDKCDDGFFRLQRCPTAVAPQQSTSKDNADILMLKLEIGNLKETCLKEFSEIKALIMKQNDIAVMESSYKKILIERRDDIEQQNAVWEVDKLFPINSDEQLNTLNSVDENYKQVAISTVKKLIYHGGLCPNMNRVFGNRIIVNYNYEGKRGKKSFKHMAIVNEILFRAAFKNGYTMADYENELRKGFKIMKNRYFKNECVKRKKSDINPEVQKNMLIEIND